MGGAQDECGCMAFRPAAPPAGTGAELDDLRAGLRERISEFADRVRARYRDLGVVTAEDWERMLQQEQDKFRAETLRTSELSAALVARDIAQAERDKLQAFKDFVHRRLDTAGIPTHPDGPHSKEGCRVGDRLDVLVGERDRAQAQVAASGDALTNAATAMNTALETLRPRERIMRQACEIFSDDYKHNHNDLRAVWNVMELLNEAHGDAVVAARAALDAAGGEGTNHG